MFRLIRFLFSLVILTVLWHAATTCQLGKKTVWGHIKAIAGSEESKELVQEVKKKAVEVKEKVVTGDGGPIKEVKKTLKKELKKELKEEAADRLTARERDALRKLIKKKSAEKPEANP